MKDQGKNIWTAFDACDVCGGQEGYRQDGDDVVCNNCGKYFHIKDIGNKNTEGGCWPAYLNHRIEDGKLLISKNELRKGIYMFT